MKSILTILFLFIICLPAISQEPGSISYQAIVRNSKGEVVPGKAITVQLSILKGNISGEVIFMEIQKTITSQLGMITLAIGNGTDQTGDFNTIEWSADDYYLKVGIDTTGRSAFTETGITQIVVVSIDPIQTEEKEISSLIEDDELLIIRKYVGRYIDYRHTGPEEYAGPNLIWIKTTMEETFGKISAYGKTCKFSAGDNLYIRKILFSPGEISGHWIYQIENDSSAFYRATELQHDKKVYIETWFQ
jgi:hypothetical protein